VLFPAKAGITGAKDDHGWQNSRGKSSWAARAEAGLQPVSFLLTEGEGSHCCRFMAEYSRAQMAIAATTA
jgi:hypothetical protein